MDDQAETVLINLLRGAGLDGLGAMTPGPEHPILGIRRTETHALCVEMNLVVAHDETNDDLRILRNRLRAELVPLLTDLSQRDPIPLLARTAELARRDSSFLEAMSTHEIPDPTKVAVLRANPEALSDRALRAWIRSARPEGEAYPPSEAELARIRSVVEGTATAAELSGGLRVARTAGILRLEGHGSGTVSS
jgi:tRNA(Ile)-lysidine synthase